MAITANLSADDYRPTLARYLLQRGEEPLYRAMLLSESFIESGLGPEDIIALHMESLEQIFQGMSHREQIRASSDAHQFLLEMMIAYGVRYKEYLELKLRERLRDAESQAARAWERTLEAERLQREKGEILGVIAHELRTPITVAKGQIDLAARSLARGQVEQIPGQLGAARQALDRLSRLSGDLVEASRGAVPALECSPQRLDAIITQATDWVRPSAASKGLSLVVEAGEELVVYGNTDALLSVLGNLLSNAVRYTPAGGQITVRAGSDGERAWVEVSDTGIGMSPDVQARIFEKFFRAPQARQVEAQGLGLGLSLVRQMVEAQHGQVEVDSMPGEGSTFRVFIPCRPTV